MYIHWDVEDIYYEMSSSEKLEMYGLLEDECRRWIRAEKALTTEEIFEESLTILLDNFNGLTPKQINEVIKLADQWRV